MVPVLHPLAAIDPSAVPLPEWVPDAMVPLGYAIVALFAAWLVLGIVRLLHRRAYNLTKAETARGKPAEPGFLKVDHEARQAALDRGDAYVRPADRVAEAEASGKRKGSAWAFLCRLGVVIVALAHFGVVVVSMADATHNAEKVVQDISATDRLEAIVSRYWLGLTLGVIVLTAEVVRFVVSRREKE
jgi:hypothetical protein